jgi:phytoene desaturase
MQLLPHVEQGIGAFIPDKGMYDITNQLFELAKRQGVQFIFNSKVNEIIVEDGKAVGIRFEENKIEKAGLIVSNMDVFPTYKKLLPKEEEPKVILNQEKSSSALIFYWGMNKIFNQLDVHNILFSSNYENEFRCLFEHKTLIEDPTVYIHITSKHIAIDAPISGENWFVMVNAPNNTGQDWDSIEKETKENIISKIESQLGENIREHIVCEKSWNPKGIENDTSSHLGALYGNASNSSSAAFFRHANNSSRIKDLYFVGGSVHPGGGVPLAILSAKTMTDLIH